VTIRRQHAPDIVLVAAVAATITSAAAVQGATIRATVIAANRQASGSLLINRRRDRLPCNAPAQRLVIMAIAAAIHRLFQISAFLDGGRCRA
jgi:hypothetical protein